MCIDVRAEEVGKTSVVDAILKLKLAVSGAEARRIIGQRAVRINKNRVDSIDAVLPFVKPGTELQMMIGTTRSAVIRVID